MPGVSGYNVRTNTAQRPGFSILPELGRFDYYLDLPHTAKQRLLGLRCEAWCQFQYGDENGANGSIPKGITRLGLSQHPPSPRLCQSSATLCLLQ